MPTAASIPARRLLAVASLSLAFFATGCANGPQGALTGAGLGAGGGAIIGSLFGSAGAGAALGAVAGGLGGAVIGDQNARREHRPRRHTSPYESRGYGPPAAPSNYEPRRRHHDRCSLCDPYSRRSDRAYPSREHRNGPSHDAYYSRRHRGAERYGPGYDTYDCPQD